MVIPKLVRLFGIYYRVVRMDFPGDGFEVVSGLKIDLEELEPKPEEIEEYEEQSSWYRSNGFAGIWAPPGSKIPRDLNKICFLRKLDNGWLRLKTWEEIKDQFIGWN